MTSAEVARHISELYVAYMKDRDFEGMMCKAHTMLIESGRVPPHEVWQIGAAIAAFYEGSPIRMH